MLKAETLNNLKGFGNGKTPGEYFYSEGMFPTQFGLAANLVVTQVDGAVANLSNINAFAEMANKTYAAADNGRIFVDNSGWGQAHPNAQTSHGNWLFTDPKGRLLYPGDRYLGMYDGATWTDNWKDMTSSITGLQPMDSYEDWVMIARTNVIALLNTTDDSINLAGFTLPSGFTIVGIKSNRSGALIAANNGNRSVALLWAPGYTRSIAPWIWFDAPIQSICVAGDQWLVTTSKSIYLTNGYTTTELVSPVDAQIQDEYYSVAPAGTLVVDNNLLIANNDLTGNYRRRKAGLYLLDLSTRLFTYAPVSTGCQIDVTLKAVFQNSSGSVLVGHAGTQPTGKYVSKLSNGIPSKATLILPFGQGSTKKTAEGINLDLLANPQYQLTYTQTFTVTAKIYNFRRPLWGYGVQSGLASAKDKLKVDGTASGRNNGQVGDEVVILEGTNAGHVRHIASIAGAGTSNEEYTLDSALPETTEDTVVFNILPFKKISTHTLSSASELKDIYFNIKNRIQGKQFLIKFFFEGITTTSLIVGPTTFIYDDAGQI